MKFYGLEIGCNKVLEADSDSEVVAVTTFGEDVTQVLVKSLRHYASEVVHEGDYIDCPATSPSSAHLHELSYEKSRRASHTYHYRVANHLLQSFLATLKLKLPSHNYIKLSNE